MNYGRNMAAADLVARAGGYFSFRGLPPSLPFSLAVAVFFSLRTPPILLAGVSGGKTIQIDQWKLPSSGINDIAFALSRSHTGANGAS